MSIINKQDSYYLDQNKGPIRDPKRDLLELFYNFEDRNYWHVSCFSGPILRRYILDVLPNHILQEIRNRNITLSIGSEYEHYVNVPETIYDYLIKELSIPAESIILFSGNANIDEIVSNIAAAENLPKIHSRWICLAEQFVSATSPTPIDTLQLKQYSKKFVCLNRRWRSCRLALLSHLKIKNLLDDGFISLQPFEGRDWNNCWSQIIRVLDTPTKELFEAHKDEIISLPSFKLDDTHLDDMNPVTHSLDEYYTNSYFSIVGGSFFYEKEDPKAAGLCEKTFKAIQKKHPFILLASPNHLDILRDIGYKTFDGLIDESYDKEPNDNKRLKMIADEVERLCKLSDSELETFLVGTRKIVDYNFRHLVSQKYSLKIKR